MPVTTSDYLELLSKVKKVSFSYDTCRITYIDKDNKDEDYESEIELVIPKSLPIIALFNHNGGEYMDKIVSSILDKERNE